MTIGPGYTVIDNNGAAQFKARRNSNYVEVTLNEFTTETNFDVLDRNNDLYKYNSTEGGVILPRGTSIIGLDLRKTKIRPLYVLILKTIGLNIHLYSELRVLVTSQHSLCLMLICLKLHIMISTATLRNQHSLTTNCLVSSMLMV